MSGLVSERRQEMIGDTVRAVCKGIEEVWHSQGIQGAANCSVELERRTQVHVHKDALCMVLIRLDPIWKVI